MPKETQTISFQVTFTYGTEEQEEFGSVESFIQEMIDQNSSDFNDVDSWDVKLTSTIQDKLKQLGSQMEQQMKDLLRFDQKTGFWYDWEDQDVYYTQEGIRLAVYEDIKDILNHLYSDCSC